MFVKSTLSTFSILATCAFLVNAAAMEERIEERQLGSLVDSITQAVGAGSYTGDIITGIASGFAPSITSFYGEPTTVTTTLNGQLVTFTEVIGHPASGSSKATSAGGSGESTATTSGSTATTTPNGALGLHASMLSGHMFSGLAAVFASMFVGAWVAL